MVTWSACRPRPAINSSTSQPTASRMTPGSNWRHLNSPQTEEASKTSCQPTTGYLQSCSTSWPWGLSPARPSFGPGHGSSSLKGRYHRTQSTMISWSKWRPLKELLCRCGFRHRWAVNATKPAFQVCMRTARRRVAYSEI
jgi:hypothetical protein